MVSLSQTLISILKAAENVCGSTRRNTGDEKREVECGCWKCSQWKVEMPMTWKNGGSKEEYQKAKHLAKHAVYLAKSQAKSSIN